MESVGSNQKVSPVSVQRRRRAPSAECIVIVFDRLLFHRLRSCQAGAAPETPTVCASTPSPGSILDDDSESDSGSESGVDMEVGGDAETVVDLSVRAPTAQRVIDAVKMCESVTASVNYSYLFAEENRDLLYSIDIWSQVNDKLVTALTACAATVEKDVKSSTKLYLQECIAIDRFAAQLCSSGIF